MDRELASWCFEAVRRIHDELERYAKDLAAGGAESARAATLAAHGSALGSAPPAAVRLHDSFFNLIHFSILLML